MNFDRLNRALYCVGLVPLELRWATRTVNLLNWIQLSSQQCSSFMEYPAIAVVTGSNNLFVERVA